MKYFFSIIFLLASLFLCGVNQASALTLSPVKAELSGYPGQTIGGEMMLFNEEKENRIFYSSFENFEAQGETGSPNFIPGQIGLAAWIDSADMIELLPQERKSVPFSIKIPADAEPGGYFAAIFWSTTPVSNNGGQLGVGAKVGTLILLKVEGDIKEGGGITEFSFIGKNNFFSTLPINFLIRIKNDGGDRAIPVGDVTIKNIFGFSPTSISVNENKSNVLPNSTRKFVVCWNGKNINDNGKRDFFSMVAKEWHNFAFGYYNANLNIKYGLSEVMESKCGFFVIPWHLLSVIFFAVAILAVIIFFSIKRYNKWIILKAIKSRKRRRMNSL